MPVPNKVTWNLSKLITAASIVLYSLCFTIPLSVFAEESAGTSFDGLKPVEGAAVAMAYIDPEADFSAFTRVMILEPYVAFRSNWQRDQNRRRSRNISARDMERIKADVASMFREVFTQNLQADDGFEVVDEADYDVLLIRPAIINLDITAPDVAAAGRSRTFTASAGQATLYIELFDSVTGTIIGRAADAQAARSGGGTMTWNNRVMNRAEGRRMFSGWANQLRSFLDQHYTAK
jgi:hypothetical protein